MARGIGSGGFGARGGGSSRSNAGAKGTKGNQGKSTQARGVNRNSSGNTSPKPKGQVRNGKTVQYSIKDPKGTTKYIGTTNNPSRRAAEHKESGKIGGGDKLVVETKPIPRTAAEKVEAAKLRSHRQTQGRNPKYNKTNDGKFPQPPLF